MDSDTFEEDVDFLFKDQPPRSRERFCSDTNFSSYMPDGCSSHAAGNMAVDSTSQYLKIQVDDCDSADNMSGSYFSGCLDTNSLIEEINESCNQS